MTLVCSPWQRRGSFQPSFFSNNDRHFPRVFGGFLERCGSLERMEKEVTPPQKKHKKTAEKKERLSARLWFKARAIQARSFSRSAWPLCETRTPPQKVNFCEFGEKHHLISTKKLKV